MLSTSPRGGAPLSLNPGDRHNAPKDGGDRQQFCTSAQVAYYGEAELLCGGVKRTWSASSSRRDSIGRGSFCGLP